MENTCGADGPDMQILLDVLRETWGVTQHMAPYLLFGFAAAGLLAAWVSPRWLERHLGGSGPGPVIKATLFGIPLPLCSCGVVPIAFSLRRHGATRGATASFLLSTPQTGVDSILATYAMFGPLFAIYRPLVALATGLLGGGLVEALGERDSVRSPAEAPAAGGEKESPKKGWARLREAVRYGLVSLPGDIALPLVIGLVISGLLAVLVPEDLIARHLGRGILPMLLLMAAGVPLYVCATASVPVAASFLALGASPGAALAFLVVGPATNAATIAVVWRVLGRRTAALYLAAVVGIALGAGLLLDLLVSWTARTAPQLVPGCHVADEPGWLAAASGAALLALLAHAWWSRRFRRSRKDRPDGGRPAGAEEDERKGALGEPPRRTRLELRVEGMRCSHCQSTVLEALSEIDGVTSARVDLAAGRATVEGRDLDTAAVVRTVEAAGYRAHEAV